MKHLFVFFLLIPSLAYTRVYTVDNNTGSVADFTSIVTAINTASSGDTLIIQPSFSNYTANMTVQKRLFIYGPGYRQQFAPGRTALIEGITLGSSSGGSTIQGLYLLGLTISGTNAITIKDCLLQGNGTPALRLGSGVTFNVSLKGCHFQGDFSQNTVEVTNNTNVTDVFFENCLFHRNPGCNTSLGYRNFGFISGGNNTLIVNHCVFFNVECSPCTSCNNTYAPFFTGSTNALFENNIFYTNFRRFSRVDTLTGSGSIFRRNITYHPSDTLIALRDSNNLNNTNPRFQNIEASSGVPNGGTIDNYRLQSGSAGKNAGTDSTDIGLYGGVYEFSNRGYSSNVPVILEVTPLNRSVRQNGVLRVRIRATTENQ